MRRLPFNPGYNFHMISDHEGRIESHPKLPNNIILHSFALLLHFLHELLGPTLSNCSQVVDQIVTGHPDTVVLDDQLVLCWGGLDAYQEVLV